MVAIRERCEKFSKRAAITAEEFEMPARASLKLNLAFKTFKTDWTESILGCDRPTLVSVIEPRCVTFTIHRLIRSESLGEICCRTFKSTRRMEPRESKSLVNPTVITGKFNRINGRAASASRELSAGCCQGHEAGLRDPILHRRSRYWQRHFGTRGTIAGAARRYLWRRRFLRPVEFHCVGLRKILVFTIALKICKARRVIVQTFLLVSQQYNYL